jgi:hypothetical protein
VVDGINRNPIDTCAKRLFGNKAVGSVGGSDVDTDGLRLQRRNHKRGGGQQSSVTPPVSAGGGVTNPA